MFQFLAIMQAGCRRSFPRHLLHRITTLAISAVVVLVAQVIYTQPVNADQASHPNIVLILTDDQGWGDLSIHGNTNLSTPHIDALARQGAQFDRFFVCPVCSPTRAEFLTGRYHPRCGVYSTSAGGERLDLDEVTIADALRAAGYATGAFGKWHNGMQYPYHPNGRGFDEYYGFCSGHWGHYFHPPLDHNGQIVRGEGFVVDDFTQRAMQFIEQHKEHPFFVYLPLNTPHSPMQVPDRWWNPFRDKQLTMRHRDPRRENLPHTRAALAMCENIDWNVGRLLQKLDDLKIADNTIVIYFCDNGPNGFRWNDGLRGRKGSTDEGGVRSPLFIRWPAQIAAGKRVRPIAAAIDLLPTLIDLASIDWSPPKPLDGASLKTVLVSDNAQWPDRLLFSHWRKRVSVRSQQFRLDHQGRLYDMLQDPGQDRDIADQQPEVALRLRNAVQDWKQSVLTELGPDERPFPIGDANFRFWQLPARDGKTQGDIRRSNRFPNCSFFTHWTRLDDRITWDAQVLEEGDYQVEIHYTCPAADVGSVVELSLGESRLRGTVTEAHDPPLRGAEQDRVPRGESYIKDFRILQLGTMHLKPGRGPLTLRALRIPGQSVMDFRLLMLTRM